MINKNRELNLRIFVAIRESVKRLHPGVDFLEESEGAPFLFKSREAQFWVRVFYQPMADYDFCDLKNEIQRLKILMPVGSQLYLFYPALERAKILKISEVENRTCFFEYKHLQGAEPMLPAVRIQKWLPAAVDAIVAPQRTETSASCMPSAATFFRNARLSREEIADLSELGLELKRASL